MAGDISINPQSATGALRPPRSGTVQQANPAQPAKSANGSAAARPPLNPDFHVDLALNLVVLQFFDAKGNLTQSIPSQKQLDAYRQEGGVPAPHAESNALSKVL